MQVDGRLVANDLFLICNIAKTGVIMDDGQSVASMSVEGFRRTTSVGGVARSWANRATIIERGLVTNKNGRNSICRSRRSF